MQGATVAILGATSHIAKGLIVNCLRHGCRQLDLFTRSPQRVREFLDQVGADQAGINIFADHQRLLFGKYDLVICCVGTGTFSKLQGDYSRYFSLMEEFDGLLLNYLRRNERALGIKFSSGVVYGRRHSAPVERESGNLIAVNQVEPCDYYALTQLYAEARHRACSRLRLVDLRIFSYFSRFADLSDGYFITDLVNAVIHGQELLTDQGNMVRDYLHPDDLFAMILLCLRQERINTAIDLYSCAPVDKQTLLDVFERHYGLSYSYRQQPEQSTTGRKNNYCSNVRRAAEFGYQPGYSSLEGILAETDLLLNGRSGWRVQ